MKRFKKILYGAMGLILSLGFALSVAACGGEESNAVELDAPVLELNGNVISWEPVEHADGYEVYEGAVRVASQEETSYTIVKTEPGDYVYTVRATSTDEGYRRSRASASVTYVVPESVSHKLQTPTVILEGNVLMWAIVTNATMYEVYEDGELVSTQSETTYTINKTESGDYVYTVIATYPASTVYEDSEPSAPVEYHFVRITLEKPNVTLEGDTLSWDVIQHANHYEILENGTSIDDVIETTYTIEQKLPGTYSYTVVAHSYDSTYGPATSDPVQRTVPVVEMTYTVHVTVAEGVTDAVIGLYVTENTTSPIASQSVPQSGTVTFTANSGAYMIRLVSGTGAEAEDVRIDANHPEVDFAVLKLGADRVILGENTYIATRETIYTPMRYRFIARKDGEYTITTTATTRNFIISVGDSIVIDASQGRRSGKFTAYNGETVYLYLQADAVGEYRFMITEGAAKQYISVSSAYGSGEANNLLSGTEKLYLRVTSPVTYTFQFGPGFGLAGVAITFTVDGKSYRFDPSVNEPIEIEFSEAREYEISVSYSGSFTGSLAFYCFRSGN